MDRAATRTGFPHLSLYLRACPEARQSIGLPLRWASSCLMIGMAASLQIVRLVRSLVPESFLGGCSVGADAGLNRVELSRMALMD